MDYVFYQTQADLMAPVRFAARSLGKWLRWGSLDRRGNPMAPWIRQTAAACELFGMIEITHSRRSFGIESVTVAGTPAPVTEQIAHEMPFGRLQHFVKSGVDGQPKVLIAAPMSGHFATLLRDTVKTMLVDHDVYVTDWRNAREVPLEAGRFGLDEYTDHLMGFLDAMGPGVHLVAICQPCVAAISAVAQMAETAHPATPVSLTLMAGPIDCRISPTVVNRLASGQGLEWFERNLITRVPARFPGAGRRVYPGFKQVAAFMNMNRERHVAAFREYFNLRSELNPSPDNQKKEAAMRDFYDEYFAVSDLPAEFFLETVERVFQRHDLPTGALECHGKAVDPSLIRDTWLLTVEGGKDDICAEGQTKAAHALMSGLAPERHLHHTQPDVGHYGVFSGRRWQEHIYPVIRSMIAQAAGAGASQPASSLAHSQDCLEGA